jgi:hypothetical protein
LAVGAIRRPEIALRCGAFGRGMFSADGTSPRPGHLVVRPIRVSRATRPLHLGVSIHQNVGQSAAGCWHLLADLARLDVASCGFRTSRPRPRDRAGSATPTPRPSHLSCRSGLIAQESFRNTGPAERHLPCSHGSPDLRLDRGRLYRRLRRCGAMDDSAGLGDVVQGTDRRGEKCVHCPSLARSVLAMVCPRPHRIGGSSHRASAPVVQGSFRNTGAVLGPLTRRGGEQASQPRRGLATFGSGGVPWHWLEAASHEWLRAGRL